MLGGTIAAKYEYDPYGNLTLAVGDAAATNPFRFSTKYFDAETGMYYYGYRYYLPWLGRWGSRDPIGESSNLNLLGFTHNCPTTRVDSLGLKDSPVEEHTACCQYKQTDQYGERTPFVVSRYQRTLKCDSSNLVNCCGCAIQGTSSPRALEHSSSGACCSCKVSIYERDVGIFGGPYSWAHQKLLVECSDDTIDADVPGVASGIGMSPVNIGKISKTSTVGYHEYESFQVDCSTAKRIMKDMRATDKSFPYCPLVTDCQDYARSRFERFRKEGYVTQRP